MLLTLSCVVTTIAVYIASRYVWQRYASPLTNPVFVSTLCIVAALLALDLGAQDYEPTKRILTLLLGPATVALAVPIYKNRGTLFAHLAPALCGIVVGCVATILTAVVLGYVLWLDRGTLLALSAKSVTAPIAIELAVVLEANPSLTVALVIVTGMIGAMMGPWLMDRMGIVHPLARGLSLGTVSHGQGTAQALAEGELQGAISGIAMGLTAIITSAALPFTVRALA